MKKKLTADQVDSIVELTAGGSSDGTVAKMVQCQISDVVCVLAAREKEALGRCSHCALRPAPGRPCVWPEGMCKLYE